MRKPGLLAAVTGLTLVGLAVAAIFLASDDSDSPPAPYLLQPVSSPVPTPTVAVSPTPTFDPRVASLAAAAEAGDADAILASLRRYFLCSALIDEVPRCPAGSGDEVVAQIGLHIYPTYRPPPLARSWLVELLEGNKLDLVLAGRTQPPDDTAGGDFFLVIEAREPRYLSGGSRVDGLLLRVSESPSPDIVEFDFYCGTRLGCRFDAEEVNRSARDPIDPIYCSPAFDPICLDLGRLIP
ncbi:MAG TPA: hypothetical protein VIB47_12215 [Dehalococcoidia bacterium]|jgi:hypothetical protein